MSKLIRLRTIIFLLLITNTSAVFAQELIINLDVLSGQPLSPTNILSYQIINPKAAVQVLLRGELSFEQNSETIKYEKKIKLNSGINIIDPITIAYTYSSNVIKDLFQNQTLPAGAYKYCITIQNDPNNTAGELGRMLTEEVNECIADENQNPFLINLIDPADGTETYEYYPILSWMVNSPIISQLNYRIRVAELRQGQEPENAIDRNNPYCQIKNHNNTFLNYPPSARRLKVFQDYVWSVDAYYKDIFMGKSETWKFKVIEDSALLNSLPKVMPYYDLNIEKGKSTIYAVGTLKLKYMLTNLRNDSLNYKLYKENKQLNTTQPIIKLKPGDNRIEIDLTNYNLKHMNHYTIELVNSKGEKFIVIFRYINPEYL